MKLYYMLLLLFSGVTCAFCQTTGYVKIKVYLEDAKQTDSLYLDLFENLMDDERTNIFTPEIEKIATQTSGFYIFDVPVNNRYPYISLGLNGNRYRRDGKFIGILKHYLAQPGDSIVIRIAKKTLQPNAAYKGTTDLYYAEEVVRYHIDFSGKGAEKYNCRYEADYAAKTDTSVKKVLDLELKPVLKNHFDVALKLSLDVLNTYREKLSQEVYDILEADFYGKHLGDKIEYIRIATLNPETRIKLEHDSKLNFLLPYKTGRQTVLPDLSGAAALYSKSYIKLIYKIEELAYFLNAEPSKGSLYEQLKANYEGELRDRVVTYYHTVIRRMNHDTAEVEESIRLMTTKKYAHELAEFYNKTKKGAMAFDFSLPDAKNKLVKLSQFKGKVVFIDFWFTGCGACKDYYRKTLSKIEEEFRDNENMVFITINVDRDRNVWLNSLEEGIYTSTHVINLYTEGRGPNHPVIQVNNVNGYPRPLLIGKDGKIFNSTASILKNTDKLREVLKEAIEEQK